MGTKLYNKMHMIDTVYLNFLLFVNDLICNGQQDI